MVPKSDKDKIAKYKAILEFLNRPIKIKKFKMFPTVPTTRQIGTSDNEIMRWTRSIDDALMSTNKTQYKDNEYHRENVQSISNVSLRNNKAHTTTVI